MKTLITTVLLFLTAFWVNAQINPIQNAEAGSSVRAKLNQVIDSINTNFPIQGLGAGSGLTDNAGNADLGGDLTSDAIIKGTTANQFELRQETFAGDTAIIRWDTSDEVFMMTYDQSGDLGGTITIAGKLLTLYGDYPGTVGHRIVLQESGSNMDFIVESGSGDTFDFSNGDVFLQQNIRGLDASYTPSLINVTNLDGSTAALCHYYRIGNLVTIGGTFSADATAAGTTELRISVPIASNFTLDTDVSGIVSDDNGGSGTVTADIGNDDFFLTWNTSLTGNEVYKFNVTYLVK